MIVASSCPQRQQRRHSCCGGIVLVVVVAFVRLRRCAAAQMIVASSCPRRQRRRHSCCGGMVLVVVDNILEATITSGAAWRRRRRSVFVHSGVAFVRLRRVRLRRGVVFSAAASVAASCPRRQRRRHSCCGDILNAARTRGRRGGVDGAAFSSTAELRCSVLGAVLRRRRWRRRAPGAPGAGEDPTPEAMRLADGAAGCAAATDRAAAWRRRRRMVDVYDRWHRFGFWFLCAGFLWQFVAMLI